MQRSASAVASDVSRHLSEIVTKFRGCGNVLALRMNTQPCAVVLLYVHNVPSFRYGTLAFFILSAVRNFVSRHVIFQHFVPGFTKNTFKVLPCGHNNQFRLRKGTTTSLLFVFTRFCVKVPAVSRMLISVLLPLFLSHL